MNESGPARAVKVGQYEVVAAPGRRGWTVLLGGEAVDPVDWQKAMCRLVAVAAEYEQALKAIAAGADAVFVEYRRMMAAIELRATTALKRGAEEIS